MYIVDGYIHPFLLLIILRNYVTFRGEITREKGKQRRTIPQNYKSYFAIFRVHIDLGEAENL